METGVMPFETQTSEVVAPRFLRHLEQERAPARLDAAGHLLARLNRVAWIGKEDSLAGEHEEHSVAAGETCQVAEVWAERNDQAIQLPQSQAR